MEKKQYLDYLTNDDVYEMVDKFGYEIVKSAAKEKNTIEPDYEKLYDEENENYNLYIKCKPKHSEKDELLNHPAFSVLKYFKEKLSNAYSTDIGLLYISDFLVKEVFVEDFSSFNDEQNKRDNQAVFANFMVEKLSEQSDELANQYINDYNEFVANYNKEVERRLKENSENENQLEL